MTSLEKKKSNNTVNHITELPPIAESQNQQIKGNCCSKITQIEEESDSDNDDDEQWYWCQSKLLVTYSSTR
jgi:hypothetical protein